MTVNGWMQILVYLAVIFAVTKPLGIFMARVFNRERTFLDPVLRPMERLLYRLTLVDEDHDMKWTEYAFSMLLFSGVSMLVLYGIRALAAGAASESTEVRGRRSGSGFQYGGFFHHQHQLAELWWRGHDELSHADGWPRISQLRCLPQSALRWRLRSFAASRGGKKRRSGISGSILRGPHCGYCCRHASSMR